ncbi:MAG: 3-phosphoshikimate 1-carboxyvinyltransferase, partial [Candidatus Lutacidiplasmatales archaeon]
LSRRPFRVVRPLDSEDTRATAAALGGMGSAVHRGPEAWRVMPLSIPPGQSRLRVHCHESGTTLRFVSALAALSARTVILDGEGRLEARPIDELLAALRQLGARCRHVHRRSLPIEIRGPIRGGRVRLNASESSQFASALLLALPTVEPDSFVELVGRVVSRPYLDATLAVLSHQGIHVVGRDRRFRVPGGQHFRGSSFAVPGDASSAAYLWAAAAVGGGVVRVRGIPREWPQADLSVLTLLKAAGADVSVANDGATVGRGTPRSFRADLTDAPDLYPLAGVLAATAPGESRILGAEHAALKESNRKTATARLARSLGAKVEMRPHGLRIQGTHSPRALDLRGLTDHRLVMSAAVGALAADGVSKVGDREAVRKSFPGFWTALRAISGGDAER